MESWLDLASGGAAFCLLLWLYAHPAKCQRERAQRTQELHDWDWRA